MKKITLKDIEWIASPKKIVVNGKNAPGCGYALVDSEDFEKVSRGLAATNATANPDSPS